MFLFPLFLTCSTSIKFIVNSSNVQQLIEYSYRIPVFMVFYSPHCGHCIKMHPEWIKFMNMYAKDQNIVAAEVDCFNFRAQAGKIMSVRGYPTYALIRNGRGETVSVTRTAKAFAEKAEQIKKQYPVKIPLKCKFYLNKNQETVKYPFMTITSSDYENSKSKNVLLTSKEVCDLIQQISKKTGIAIEQFYVNHTKYHFSDQNQINPNFQISKIHLNPTFYVDISNYSNSTLYDQQIFQDYAIEYMKYFPFGKWDIADSRSDSHYILKKSNKRLVLFVYDDNAQDQATNILMMFKSLAVKMADHFFANHISSQILKEMWKIDLMNNCTDSNSKLCKSIHLIVTDNKKTSFSLFKNVTEAGIKGIFDNISNGTFDSRTDRDIHALIDFNAESNEILNKNDKHSSNHHLMFLIPVLALIVILAIYINRINMINLDNPDSKNLIEHSENSQNDDQIEGLNDQIVIINESGDEPVEEI